MTTIAVPDKLTDAEAREILDKVAPRAKKISDEINRANARAEQGQLQLAKANEKALSAFATDDPVKLRAILDERKANNATKVREYLASLDTTEAKTEDVKKSAMAHR